MLVRPRPVCAHARVSRPACRVPGLGEWNVVGRHVVATQAHEHPCEHGLLPLAACCYFAHSLHKLFATQHDLRLRLFSEVERKGHELAVVRELHIESLRLQQLT